MTSINDVLSNFIEDELMGSKAVSRTQKLNSVIDSIEDEGLRDAVILGWAEGSYLPMPGDDFGQALVHASKIQSTPTVYRDGCYICEDPEYSMMGLPLCYKCPECSGHIPADDTLCDDCGYDMMDSNGEMDCG